MQGLKSVSELLIELIFALEKKSNTIDYHEIPASNDSPEREFNIYLGTIPDYTSGDVSGVTLSGVAKDSPAYFAGLKQHDVIIELAGIKINNIYDYTYVLNGLPVGKPVKLVALRHQEKVVLTITARYRE